MCLNCCTKTSDTPERPRDLTAVVVTTTGVLLEWVEPHDNNAPILGYRVSYTRPLFLNGLEVTVNSSVERVNITGLHPGVTYTFSVIAFNEIGDSTPSDGLMVTTVEIGKTGTNLKVVSHFANYQLNFVIQLNPFVHAVYLALILLLWLSSDWSSRECFH